MASPPLELALLAWVAKRCERAYVHDLRNGMQGIYASFDVLTRIASGKAPAQLSIEKVTEMSRKAITAHEQSMTQSVQHIVGREGGQSGVELASLMRALVAFLNNDALARGVKLNLSQVDSRVSADPARLRTALLAIMTRAIDALDGGELTMSAQSGDRVAIEFTLGYASPYDEPALWRSEPARADGWIWAAVEGLVAGMGGTLETTLGNPSSPEDQTTRRIIRVRLPAQAVA